MTETLRVVDFLLRTLCLYKCVADPDPYFLVLLDPFVRGTDPDLDRCIIKQNSKQNFDSLCFVASL